MLYYIMIGVINRNLFQLVQIKLCSLFIVNCYSWHQQLAWHHNCTAELSYFPSVWGWFHALVVVKWWWKRISLHKHNSCIRKFCSFDLCPLKRCSFLGSCRGVPRVFLWIFGFDYFVITIKTRYGVLTTFNSI